MRETAVIVAEAHEIQGCQHAPALAGRMGDDGARASVILGVTDYIPWVNARDVKIIAVRLHVEGRHCFRFAHICTYSYLFIYSKIEMNQI
jgi:hypothetical protein